MTNPTGNYTFSVPAGGTYTITPVSAVYTFQPATTTYSNLTASVASSSPFTGVPDNFTISGQVTTNGSAGFPGVTVKATDTGSGQVYSATTDGSGNYAIQVPTSTYTVQPSLLDYTFSPPPAPTYNVAANQTGVNFALALPTCGAWTSPAKAGFNASYYPGGGPIKFSLPVAGASGPSDSVSFQVAGPGPVNPLAASGASGSFSATLNLTGLALGPYKVTTVAVNGAGTQTCTGSPAFFSITSITNNNPAITHCPSMVGTWAMTAGGQQAGTWTVTKDSPAEGNYKANVTCNDGSIVTLTYPILSSGSSYSSGNQSFTFKGGNAGPLLPICSNTLNASSVANITGSVVGAPLCGMVYPATFTSYGVTSGTTGTLQNQAVTLTSTERDPTSETTQFVSWLDQGGAPTIATFQMTLNPVSGVYGGRQIVEQYGYGTSSTNGPSDGCWFPGAAWSSGDLNKVAALGKWNVQSQNGNSTYGVDFVGLYPNQVSWMQYYDPNVNGIQGSSCAIQTPMFIQINVENSDTGQQYNTYNTQDLLIYTIGTNSYSVQRGGVTASRQFHQ